MGSEDKDLLKNLLEEKEKLQQANDKFQNEKDEATAAKERFDILIGLMVALVGAFLAIASIGAGKYGDDEILASNASAKAFSWYQSKSIKNTSIESQRDLLDALTHADAIKQSHTAGVDSFMKRLDDKSQKYKKEMNEILKGSANIPKEEWIQDKGGEFGKIIGAQEWENKSELLGAVGDWFDYCTLFLNVSLVFGAICFVVQNVKLRRTFFIIMCTTGIVGSVLSIIAFQMAFAIP